MIVEKMRGLNVAWILCVNDEVSKAEKLKLGSQIFFERASASLCEAFSAKIRPLGQCLLLPNSSLCHQYVVKCLALSE